ncbi:MAG: PD-(D/E)XK nuclease family protein [Patescibacteria group bacterium]|nr:PD-(D/E)XK nuclease family protein [Patescibacteria group bacterium]MDE1945874.1 PD-(D/E)XK nuclease family protein [Patescibacteria group bacterium]
MSEYYKGTRGAAWNYGGGNWKLSRSKIDLFLECPRCFYLDNKLGVKRVPGFPFSINSAVDHLLKQEFDAHRAKGEQHPLQKEYGIDAKPAPHDELDEWRRNFGGVKYIHEPTGLTVTGAIDDLWINGKGEYIVVDYKATAKEEAVKELDKEWQNGYKRQMEVYQWLLRKNGLNVSDTGYFVYCTGKMDRQAFDKRIDFDVNLIPYKGSDAWVEKTLLAIKKCLDAEAIPKAGADCDWCLYRQSAKDKEK